MPVPGVRRPHPAVPPRPCRVHRRNILIDADIADRLEAYRFHDRCQGGANPTCGSCDLARQCGQGFPAAVISAGERIGAVDAEVCPVTNGVRDEVGRLLPLMPV